MCCLEIADETFHAIKKNEIRFSLNVFSKFHMFVSNCKEPFTESLWIEVLVDTYKVWFLKCYLGAYHAVQQLCDCVPVSCSRCVIFMKEKLEHKTRQ